MSLVELRSLGSQWEETYETRREMTLVYAPDEEKRRLRKEKLKKIRKVENWRIRRAQYGARNVLQRGMRRMWEE